MGNNPENTADKRYYVTSTFDVRQDDTAWNTFKASAFQLIVAMQGGLRNWHMLAGLSSFTDLPNSVLHLWKVASPTDLTDGKKYFEDGTPLNDAMLGTCESPSTNLLEATDYDPDFKPGGTDTQSESPDGRFYFLWVELTLRPGKTYRSAFTDACRGLLARMEHDLPTWKLIAAGASVTGRPNTVMHLWQLKDANALLEGMNWFGENNADYQALERCCLRQRQQLYTSMIYNPLGVNGANTMTTADREHAKNYAALKEREEQKMAEIPDTNLVVYAYKTKDDSSTAGVFSIPLSVYTDEKYRLKDGEGGLPKYLLAQGVVAANMRNDEAGEGGFCYLLNIPALQPPVVDPAAIKLKPEELVAAIGALVQNKNRPDADKKTMATEFQKLGASFDKK